MWEKNPAKRASGPPPWVGCACMQCRLRKEAYGVRRWNIMHGRELATLPMLSTLSTLSTLQRRDDEYESTEFYGTPAPHASLEPTVAPSCQAPFQARLTRWEVRGERDVANCKLQTAKAAVRLCVGSIHGCSS